MTMNDNSTTNSVENAHVADESTETKVNQSEDQDSSEDQHDGVDSEDSEGNDDANQDEDGGKDDAKKPHRNGFKKRLDREKRKLAEKDQEIEYWKKEALKRNEEKPSTESNKAVDEDPEPNPDDFSTVGEYARAVTKWEIKQATKQAKEQEKRQAEQSEVQTRFKTAQKEYNTKVTEFKKSTPDFDDVVADFVDEHQDFKVSGEVMEALMTSDFGPQIFYDLIKKPGEYERFSKMSTIQQIRELGKNEARIAAKVSSSQEFRTSKAPAPVSTIGKGMATKAKSLSDPNISFAEYERIRMEQLKSKK